MNRYVIHAEDAIELPRIYGAVWPFFVPSLFRSGQAEKFPAPKNWQDIGGLVVLDGAPFESEKGAVAVLSLLFKKFRDKSGRNPRVYRVGPQGGLTRVLPHDLESKP